MRGKPQSRLNSFFSSMAFYHKTKRRFLFIIRLSPGRATGGRFEKIFNSKVEVVSCRFVFQFQQHRILAAKTGKKEEEKGEYNSLLFSSSSSLTRLHTDSRWLFELHSKLKKRKDKEEEGKKQLPSSECKAKKNWIFRL